MFGKYKYLILILVVIVLLAPRPTLAVFGIGDFGLFDIPDQILGGLEEKTGPIFTAVATVFITYMAGLAALSLSGAYLEKFIYQQDGMITALEPMTRAGWDFSAGLANMLLVLIFLIIAFAFIFKIETFQAQKALPKLILVALLLNFSFLFVQMLIDLSQILYNTVLPETPLFSTVMEVLISPGKSVITTVVSWIAALGISLAIPMVNAFTQILLSTLFTVLLLPNIIIWIIQAIFFWLLALMFFFFIFLFGARVFVLQMLMILAPLAFLCLILPQTKSFWSQWFKFLLEWLLLGIFFLFFLVLGFGTLSLLTPSVDALPLPGASMFKLGGFLVYYFVVFIYMAVILFVGKKFIPSGAQALIDMGKGIAGTVVARGLKPIGKSLKEKTLPRAQEDLAKSKRIQDWAEKQALAKTPGLKGWRKLATPAVAPWYALRRGVGQTLGPGLIGGVQGIFDKTEKKHTGHLYEQKVSALLGERTSVGKAAIISALNEDGEIEKLLHDEKFIDKKTGEHTILTDEERLRIAGKAGQLDRAKKVIPALLPSFKNLPEEQQREAQNKWLRDAGVKVKDWEKDTFKIKDEIDKVIGRAKPSNVKYFSSDALAGEGAQEAIHKFWHGGHISQAATEFGRIFLDMFQDGGNKRGLDWYKNNNPRMAKYWGSSAAHALGLEVPPQPTPPSPPEVPPQWVPGPRPGTWNPPEGYAPRTHTRAEENAMVEEVNKMTSELNRLRKLAIKSTEDEETIKMLESAIRDIRQRLGK